MKREILIGAFAALSAPGIAGAAQREDSKALNAQAVQMDSLATSTGNQRVESRISSDFSTFAGSTANSDSLVRGLRNGTPITLTSTDAKGVITETTFTPSTGKIGYGNVFISLALAKQQLAGLGITQPTAQQLQTALIGENGVLTLRAQGMGWGQIAQSYGFKLGPVISGMKAANAQVSAPPTTAAGATSPSAAAKGGSGANSGVTTAAGSTNAGHGNAYGRGITTGAGGAAGQGVGNAYGRGITSGAGGAPGQSGTAGQAKGIGKGG
jgi:hypothetical protein